MNAACWGDAAKGCYEEGCKLERELAEANAEIKRLVSQRDDTLNAVWVLLRERSSSRKQLTAHKAALEKCEIALNFMRKDLAHEALLAIKQLNGVK
jgi:hypothetical protein